MPPSERAASRRPGHRCSRQHGGDGATPLQAVSAARYALGVALVVMMVAALAFGSRRVRGRLLPGWGGAASRLAGVVLRLGGPVPGAAVPGGGGVFRRWTGG